MKIATNNKKGYEEITEGDYINLQFNSSSTRRGRVGKQIAQTLLCSDEQGVAVKSEVEKAYLSEKGVRLVLAPNRGMVTNVNPEVAIPLTVNGTQKWQGSFISPDIDHIERPTTIGNEMPTKIVLKDGETMTSDDDTSHLRIRKLTPLECIRLMDFDDEDYMRMKAIESNTQIYSQAGNSIVVNCLVAIFGQMFEGKETVYRDRFEKGETNGQDIF